MEYVFAPINYYCLDKLCTVSVFNRALNFKISFTAQNLAKTHFCPLCTAPLVSAIDIMVEQLVTEVQCNQPNN